MLVIVLALLCMLVLIPSGTIVANAEIIQYALEDKKAVVPQADGYGADGLSYTDPSITVTISKGRVNETNYMVARVKVANAANRPAQRMCLAQVGKLEYLCICTEGPEDPGSEGMTLEQFAEFVANLEGIRHAYNLDGGSSSTMVFNRDKINSPRNPKKRPLKDVICFVSAYQAE